MSSDIYFKFFGEWSIRLIVFKANLNTKTNRITYVKQKETLGFEEIYFQHCLAYKLLYFNLR